MTHSMSEVIWIRVHSITSEKLGFVMLCFYVLLPSLYKFSIFDKHRLEQGHSICALVMFSPADM